MKFSKKQMQGLQSQFAGMMSAVEQAEVEGSAGSGLVTVKLNGKHKMTDIQIKPDCVDPEDVEALQDLIQAAYEDANKKLEDQLSSIMPGMPGF